MEELLKHGVFHDTWLTIQNLLTEQKNKERDAEDATREQEAAANQAEGNEPPPKVMTRRRRRIKVRTPPKPLGEMLHIRQCAP